MSAVEGISVAARGAPVSEDATAPQVTQAFSLVVPLYNEERRFGAAAERFAEFLAEQPHGTELIFVDDGSDDGTGDAVERFADAHPRLRISLLRRPHLGKGAAVQAGLQAAGAAYAAFCDVDLATPLADVLALVREAQRGPHVAIGSRDLATSRITRHESALREALGRAFNRVVRRMLVPGVVDTQCGAKAAAREVWERVLPHCREQGFSWDVEVLAIALAQGIGVEEVPVSWAHDPDSRVRVVRDGMAMLRALPRIKRRARSLKRGARPAAQGGGVFDEENAEALAASDADHWWFRSKAEFVSSMLPSRNGDAGMLVDVGAGSGGVTALLEWPSDRKVAVDGSETLVRVASERHGIEALQADVAAVPLESGSSEVVCLLDVIEHLDDPQPALSEARRLLSDDGRLVVTVPAHMWLWSAADEALGHARRYNRRTLREELERSGFRVMHVSHVFSWLVPPVWLKRRLSSSEPQLGLDVSSPAIDRAARLLTNVERRVVKRAPLPAGTSLICVAAPRD